MKYVLLKMFMSKVHKGIRWLALTQKGRKIYATKIFTRAILALDVLNADKTCAAENS